MGLRETFKRLTDPADESAPTNIGQPSSRAALPPLDLAVPKDFQTATFAYG